LGHGKEFKKPNEEGETMLEWVLKSHMTMVGRENTE